MGNSDRKPGLIKRLWKWQTFKLKSLIMAQIERWRQA